MSLASEIEMINGELAGLIRQYDEKRKGEAMKNRTKGREKKREKKRVVFRNGKAHHGAGG